MAFDTTANLREVPDARLGYRTGTFTPTVSFSTTSTATYTTQTGYYTIIGDRLFFNLRLVFDKGTSSGTMTIVTGLSNTALENTPVSVYLTNAAAGAAEKAVFADAVGGASQLRVFEIGTASVDAAVQYTDASLAATGTNVTINLAGH